MEGAQKINTEVSRFLRSRGVHEKFVEDFDSSGYAELTLLHRKVTASEFDHDAFLDILQTEMRELRNDGSYRYLQGFRDKVTQELQYLASLPPEKVQEEVEKNRKEAKSAAAAGWKPHLKRAEPSDLELAPESVKRIRVSQIAATDGSEPFDKTPEMIVELTSHGSVLSSFEAVRLDALTRIYHEQGGMDDKRASELAQNTDYSNENGTLFVVCGLCRTKLKVIVEERKSKDRQFSFRWSTIRNHVGAQSCKSAKHGAEEVGLSCFGADTNFTNIYSGFRSVPSR